MLAAGQFFWQDWLVGQVSRPQKPGTPGPALLAHSGQSDSELQKRSISNAGPPRVCPPHHPARPPFTLFYCLSLELGVNRYYVTDRAH
ncbi:hypothetical protein CKAH01_05961 [Colletotrichum kahawae]|uniref:Uncharacterized protein n=1 Tax=Colletotrichum kahawae TaxID=34407 RepID=A0AAE0D3S4_COLKA|nr:hypothetical protein CKAH01_05961 [Colletotrichum kahawae]